MGILEPVTHSEEIEKLVSEAQNIYNTAKDNFEKQQKATSRSLERLGRIKIEMWSDDMSSFVDTFNSFKNIEMRELEFQDLSFQGQNEPPAEMLSNITSATMTAREITQTGLVALGSGALVGIASYGGAMMFAHASTGTAIAALSGVAKTNATLAFFGGGTLKAGGLGVAGGKLVLAGIAIAPILIVGGIITAVKSKAKLAEAKKVHEEAENAAAQMETVTTGMKGIQQVSDNYSNFMRKFSGRFRPFIEELQAISQDYSKDADGKVDFDSLSEVEQKTVHIAWLLGQLFYKALDVPILTDQGTVSGDATHLLTVAKNDFRVLDKEASALEDEKRTITHLLDDCRTAIPNARSVFDSKKEQTFKALEKLAKKKAKAWLGTASRYSELLSHFENVDLPEETNQFFNISDEQIITDLISGSRVIQTASDEFFNKDNSAYTMEFAARGGSDFLVSYAEKKGNANSDNFIQLSDAANWLCGNNHDLKSIGGVDNAEIDFASQIIEQITGKESLSRAEQLNASITAISERINHAATALDDVPTIVSANIALLKKLDIAMKPFVKELSAIYKKHGSESIDYDSLDADEKNVILMSWRIARLFYYALSMPILEENGTFITNQNLVIAYCNNQVRTIKKESYSMSGEYQRAADVIWKPYSLMAMIIGFLIMSSYAFIGIKLLIDGNLLGLIPIGGMFLALPVFFVFKTMPESKKMLWRSIRAYSSIVIVFLLLLLL